MILDLTYRPELIEPFETLQNTHHRMGQLGFSSYELGPYATRDVVNALRGELEESRKDFVCLACELDGHDATECLMNLRQLKEDIQTLIAWADDGGDEESQNFAACMRAKYPKP